MVTCYSFDNYNRGDTKMNIILETQFELQSRIAYTI